jgi:hypothetical protein
MPNTGTTLCAIFRIPLAGLDAFQAYEAAVLPLLEEHGGSLQRRLRSAGGLTEIHLIWFPSPEHVAAYRADPRRSAHAHQFEASGAVAEVLTVADVEPDRTSA